MTRPAPTSEPAERPSPRRARVGHEPSSARGARVAPGHRTLEARLVRAAARSRTGPELRPAVGARVGSVAAGTRAHALGLVALAGLLGCSEVEGRVLHIMAASSLTEVMRDLAAGFERTHPGLRVDLQVAGSQTLRLQVEHGARADLFASAAIEHLDRLAEAGLSGPARVFAENALVVVVPPDNPAGIEGIEDLVQASRLVVGTAEVPIGAYTRQVLEALEREGGPAAAIRERIVSEEANVRLVRAKVELGEADAAVVYASDAAQAEGRLRSVPVPARLQPRINYGIALLRPSEDAEAFLEHVASADGRAVLERHGFASPSR